MHSNQLGKATQYAQVCQPIWAGTGSNCLARVTWRGFNQENRVLELIEED
jgi:hypothetical protein